MKEPSQRVKDILANMSIEQKAAQLSCVIPSLVFRKRGNLKRREH